MTQPNVTPMPTWIVDWDIPMKDLGARRRFYRRLKKICGGEDSEWERSTLSVLVTEDRILAQRVYVLAAAFGRANLYKAELVESST